MKDTPHRLMSEAESRAEMAVARIAELEQQLERLKQSIPEILQEAADMGCLRGRRVHCAEWEPNSVDWCVACKARAYFSAYFSSARQVVQPLPHQQVRTKWEVNHVSNGWVVGRYSGTHFKKAAKFYDREQLDRFLAVPECPTCCCTTADLEKAAQPSEYVRGLEAALHIVETKWATTTVGRVKPEKPEYERLHIASAIRELIETTRDARQVDEKR